jgi:hypothetical protein
MKERQKEEKRKKIAAYFIFSTQKIKKQQYGSIRGNA